MESWSANGNGIKSKDVKDEDHDDANPGDVSPVDDLGAAMPSTPTVGRPKKAAASSSAPTAGTGAGVKKKRASGTRRATNGGGRGRKPKSEAIIKAEDEEDDDINNDMKVDSPVDRKNGNGMGMFKLDSPVDHKNENGMGMFIKSEFMPSEPTAHQSFEPPVTVTHPNPEFIDFPVQLPALVLERRAIMLKVHGIWDVSPVEPQIHTQWLARLPAHIQSQFYVQAEKYHARIMDIDEERDYDDAFIKQQLLKELYGPPKLTKPEATTTAAGAGNMNGGYGGASIFGGNNPMRAGNGNYGMVGHESQPQRRVDLNSIPPHPDYIERLQREQEAREKEIRELDVRTIFGKDLNFDGWHE
jgi:hypothetical protein